MSQPPAAGTTTWIDRFNAALGLLTGGVQPPPHITRARFSGEDNFLQNFVATQMRAMPWAQAIEIIDAAERLADNPEEDERHLPRPVEFERREQDGVVELSAVVAANAPEVAPQYRF